VTKPMIGELVLGLAGMNGMLKNVASDFFDKRLVEHFEQRYRVQMQFKGFRRAILSTMRNQMLEPCMEIYRNVGRLACPKMLVWGRYDTTVPLSQSEDICAVMPDIEFHVIEDCSHIPHYEKPEETNALLLDFLRK
jgi:pimeloyl-ACP methyl ester carboxylesterase